ncbi:hypothetical protein E2P81_ATG11635 [Venturia nashicola]|uniref:Uncharacterized protein n=1 Tax=Venturia nashicola TaxID=86259 RepID=A0A4Z1ND78_9PEZI|nr:hypothetical protein E6O75_ATG11328 [Venturia nashicola]TLD18725.1 hypothetical protein E2P81_ATG11635 [Venturia nashicola]
MAQEKAMSSRLLTMKFMQRAANASPKSTPSTPDGPPSKRQRLSYGSNASPATPSSDQRAIQAALAEEEMKRSVAVERQAAEAGESRWVLSVQQPKIAPPAFQIVQASFAELDSTVSDDDQEEGEYNDSPAGKTVAGRMSFGKVAKPASVDSSEEEDSSDDEDEDDDSATAMIKEARRAAAQKLRAARKAKKDAERAKLQRFASDRRSKEVNLNSRMPQSISSANTKGKR